MFCVRVLREAFRHNDVFELYGGRHQRQFQHAVEAQRGITGGPRISLRCRRDHLPVGRDRLYLASTKHRRLAMWRY